MSTLTQDESEALPGVPAHDVPAPVPAGRGLRLVRGALWGILLATIVGVVALKLFVPKPSNLPVLFPAARFTLTDQNGRDFSSADLRGRPWVAAFIFTHCGGACPRMTATMAAMQKQLPSGVQLVSFSVDPEHDTPGELKAYAALYRADETRWHFLTGPTPKVMDVISEMKLAFSPAERGSPILHSEKLLLVEAGGLVRGAYHSNDPEEIKQLVSDSAALAKDARRGGLMRWLSQPTRNAGTAGAAGVTSGRGSSAAADGTGS